MDSLNELIEIIKTKKLGELRTDFSFEMLTSLKIGGKIRLVYYPRTIEFFIFVLKYLKKNNVRYCILGSGTNVLCSSNDFDGVVFIMSKLDISYYFIKNSLYISSGFSLSKLYKEFGPYYGFVNLSLIPGTIGGGVVNNCGNYNFCIADVIEKVQVYDCGVHWLESCECQFDYRSSIFKNSSMTIFFAKLSLQNGVDLYNELLKTKKGAHNVGKFNAGSTFKNPKGFKAWELIKKYAKTRRIGNCAIAKKHCNFFVNEGGGTSSEMIELLLRVKKEVYEKCGIMLEYEWTIIE